MQRSSAWRALLCLASSCAIVLPAGGSAQAAVLFKSDGALWPAGRMGLVDVPVCVESSSSTEQKRPQWEWTVHDKVPALADVIGQVRDALRDGYERHSALRFTGWRACTGEPGVVRLKIHPDEPNKSGTGRASAVQNGTRFTPWGGSAISVECIRFNGRQGRHEYEFSCAREYAAHEFGHAIGLAHEWRHPRTPEGCAANTPAGERPLRKGEFSYSFGDKADYWVATPQFDRESLMTYQAKRSNDCVTRGGHRFGSSKPTANDLIALKTAYPRPAEPPDMVGVIPSNARSCPATSRVTIHLDNEDRENGNGRGGWLGAIGSDANTRLEFCRVPGSAFGLVPGGAGRAADYAVLQLGARCPVGSEGFARLHDDEDDHNRDDDVDESGANTDWMAGDTGPTHQAGSRTELRWCVFGEKQSLPRMTAWPAFDDMAYGVLAAADLPGLLASGFVRTDDEDDDNKNRFVGSSRDGLARAARLVQADKNTLYRLAKVQNGR